MISRRLDPVNGAYITGLRNVMNFMLDSDQSTRMRVSSVIWVEDNNRFEILWSYSPSNAKPALTTSSLQAYANQIPMMSDGDTVVVVETEVDYEPAFDVGLGHPDHQAVHRDTPASWKLCDLHRDEQHKLPAKLTRLAAQKRGQRIGHVAGRWPRGHTANAQRAAKPPPQPRCPGTGAVGFSGRCESHSPV